MNTVSQSGPTGTLRDVTLRDGLQLTGKILSVDRKVEIVRRLLELGVPEIELGSMARPDKVPPMSNTLDVVRALSSEELERCWIWIATPKHAAMAIEAGATNLQYCLSVSDAHNRANIGRSVHDSMEALPEAINLVKDVGGRIQLCLATAFTCPFEGPVDPDAVLTLVEDPRSQGTDDIVVCDTLGQSVPQEVGALISRVASHAGTRRVVFHGHDTWGMGVANSLTALASGASVVDGALGGLGGCPFAPGASGNTSSEDLLFATRPEGFTPNTFAGIVRLSESVLNELEEPNNSKAAQGSRSTARAFPWVIEEVVKS